MSKAPEFYGSIKFMPQDQLESKLKKTRDEITDLMAEVERRRAFTPEMRLADRLHRLLHFATDCDYNYSDWPYPKGCRGEFLILAKALSKDVSSEAAELMLTSMESAKFGRPT